MTSTAWDNRSAASTGEAPQERTLGQWLAPLVTLAAVLYNFGLCFVNTKLVGISPSIVISAEITLVGIALCLVRRRNSTLYAVLLLLAVYFYAVMVFRCEFDAKIIRDILIPIAFFFLGCSLGSLRSADRLVTALIVIAFGVAIFEWLALGTYLQYFDVSRYYIARGTATEEEHQYFQGFFNSTRFANRTMLPLLGDHRVSGVFLEAPSVGNFGTIVFAWMLLRDRKHSFAFIAKTVAIVAIIVLADARFGLFFGLLTLVLFGIGRVIRPTMLFIAPFLAMIALVTYAGVEGREAFSNDMMRRTRVADGLAMDSLV